MVMKFNLLQNAEHVGVFLISDNLFDNNKTAKLANCNDIISLTNRINATHYVYKVLCKMF